ncbi:MAG: hypothetical protein HYZ27_11575 [Deltaproteobacteria bacterium]|nr:hypothetical protein [Deltaproteobacteria bacterium]
MNRLSSFGVRDWVHIMETLRKKVDRILFVECSPVTVAQLNMVTNFTGGGTVVSVQLPYYCEACHWDAEVTYPLPGKAVQAAQLPQMACKRCQRPMKFDDMPESYFAFAQKLAGPPVDATTQAFIRDFARAMDTAAGVKRMPAVADKARGVARRVRSEAQRFTARLPDWSRQVRARLEPGWRWLRERPRLAMASGAGLAVVLLVIVIAAATPPGVPADELALFYEHVAGERFADAEKLLARLQQDGLTDKLHEQLSQNVKDERQRVASAHRRQIEQLWQRKRYAELVGVAERAARVSPLDADSSFAVAESLRQLDKLGAAEPHYARFAEQKPRWDRRDGRLDDALFWRAQALIESGRIEDARRLLRMVAYEMPGTNFRRAALSRLRELAGK